MATGRFAPSPTGDLHVGNLRTALAAWLFARSTGSAFIMRMEDLDRHQSNDAHMQNQLRDLAALGLDWDGDVVRQSERFDRYEAAITTLSDQGLTYPCYCTRREIQEASGAPHGEPVPDGAYPGTCRDLTRAERTQRESSGRPPALRLRAQVDRLTVTDDLHGPIEGLVDDVVLRRNDGVPAYNLAVVVDDAAQGVEQVVRGDDLASSSPRQRHLADLLGLPAVRYAHIPLVLGPDRKRLAKRDGAITLGQLERLGVDPMTVRADLARSLGVEPETLATTRSLVENFDARNIPSSPYTFIPPSSDASSPYRWEPAASLQ